MSDDQYDDLDLLDSERLAIARVYQALTQSIGTTRDSESFRREIENRFHEIGFHAKVIFRDIGDNVMSPEVSITGRTEANTEGFDHERMAHEVQADILGTGRSNSDRVAPVSVPGGSAFSKSKSGLYLPGS